MVTSTEMGSRVELRCSAATQKPSSSARITAGGSVDQAHHAVLGVLEIDDRRAAVDRPRCWRTGSSGDRAMVFPEASSTTTRLSRSAVTNATPDTPAKLGERARAECERQRGLRGPHL